MVVEYTRGDGHAYIQFLHIIPAAIKGEVRVQVTLDKKAMAPALKFSGSDSRGKHQVPKRLRSGISFDPGGGKRLKLRDTLACAVSEQSSQCNKRELGLNSETFLTVAYVHDKSKFVWGDFILVNEWRGRGGGCGTGRGSSRGRGAVPFGRGFGRGADLDPDLLRNMGQNANYEGPGSWRWNSTFPTQNNLFFQKEFDLGQSKSVATGEVIGLAENQLFVSKRIVQNSNMNETDGQNQLGDIVSVGGSIKVSNMVVIFDVTSTSDPLSNPQNSVDKKGLKGADGEVVRNMAANDVLDGSAASLVDDRRAQ